jgi:hypothetical protein
MHQPRLSQTYGHPRAKAVASISLVLLMGLAVSVVAASAPAAAAAPAAKQAAKRVSPPKVSTPPKQSSSSRAKHRRSTPVARAALCSAPLVGDWRNINANTNAITRALVTFTCNDHVLCDTDGNCTSAESYYSTQLFGKCHPTDCDWGRARAYPMYDGWIRSMYYFGFKTSHVWLKTYNYYGLTYLRVWVHNDFASWDGRTDYTTDEWFLR